MTASTRAFALVLCCALVSADEPATRVLERGDLRITVALPDPEHGYYRGIRFDHAGIVIAAVWRGHSFLGLLKPPRVATEHDGSAGAPEEFHMEAPPGFAEAADGGTFLKIGVGELVRPDREDYHFNGEYAVARRATYAVSEMLDGITCSHESRSGAYTARGSRTIRLLPTGDGFSVERELANAGTVTLPVSHYNHSMVVIDGRPIGPDYTLGYAGPVAVENSFLSVDGPLVLFTAPLPTATAVWTLVKGLPDLPAAATLRIVNKTSGVAMELSGDTVPAKVVLYAEQTAICPEFFTAFTLQPGESKRWTQTYRFSAIH